ncbi:S-adenosyl methyltransferase [Nonomuraea solani]|uniref:S-adenosyl methyltransferase n=1 Tax=Nonomuraea solani TaxID=1144553 RepID=A0A1H5ZZD9_9ACTN|nr:SAM-dependent methyltransferase [Nonomuraea solani]SEG41839.1 S-adenosyl methyltransferase [Nonomuraea solani]
MTNPSRVPKGINPSIPNSARMYDYYLGGKDNFAADREAAEKIMALGPSREICLANRRFLGRAVRHVAAQGIDQFIDLGTGLPNQNNVHEVARKAHPQARIVYVDFDPVVIVHARALLAGTDAGITIVHADVREPAAILDAPETRRLIDFSKPVGVIFLGVLHCLTDKDDPWGVVAEFRDRMAPGSAVVISHLTDDAHPEVGVAAREVYEDADAPLIHRSHKQVTHMFDGFDLVDPGVTHVADWRPDEAWEKELAGSEWWYVGVAHKP